MKYKLLIALVLSLLIGVGFVIAGGYSGGDSTCSDGCFIDSCLADGYKTKKSCTGGEVVCNEVKTCTADGKGVIVNVKTTGNLKYNNRDYSGLAEKLSCRYIEVCSGDEICRSGECVKESKPPPEGCFVYDDFSGDTLDLTKWEEIVGSNIDEHFVDNSEEAYHTAQLTVSDKDILLKFRDKTFVPGDIVEYDVNYVSGSGNRQSRVQIDDLRYSILGFWNTVEDAGVGNDFGSYHVKITFTEEGISNEITLPDGTTKRTRPDGNLLSPGLTHTFGIVTRTGHNGVVHLDYDNVIVCKKPEEPKEPVTGWITKAPMPTARRSLGSGVVNGIIYAIGGHGSGGSDKTEAYNPTTDTWTTKASMPTSRGAVTASVVDGKIYVFGGCCNKDTVEAYDPVTDTWITKASMPTARRSLASSVFDGKIYVIGGLGGENVVEKYDPVLDSWTQSSPIPTGRGVLASSVVDGIIYVIGGRSGGSVVNTVEAYNPATDIWTTKASMPTAREVHKSSVIDGIIYVSGGWRDGDALNIVEAYNPITDTWTIKASMPTAREDPTSNAVNGKIYVIGGYFNGVHLNVVEEYTPGSGEIFCIDSDERDYDVKGTTCVGEDCKSDSCLGPDIAGFNLIEYVCQDDGERSSVNYNCPSGCVDGACIEDDEVCLESESKTIKLGSSATINGLEVEVVSIPFSEDPNKFRAVLNIPNVNFVFPSSSEGHMVTMSDHRNYLIELVTTESNSATVKVSCYEFGLPTFGSNNYLVYGLVVLVLVLIYFMWKAKSKNKQVKTVRKRRNKSKKK